MSAEQNYGDNLRLGFGESLGVLLPYLRDRIFEQIKCVWFIILYLILFQVFVLGLPIIYSLTIALGIMIVILGLSFFMEGLRLGLMPLGEVVGSVMPRKFLLAQTLAFAFVLGIAATFAEPAIMVLKDAGSGISPEQAPLLYSLLNDFTTELVVSVGVGVGVAVMLGVLRFFKSWSLKPFIYLGVGLLTLLTALAFWGPSIGSLPAMSEILTPILGLAWDCGAVTTGPVTVPLVLALGIGVCRIVSSGDSSNAGFGIVTLASLFPILAIFCLSFFHYFQDDYYGRPAYVVSGSAELSQQDAGIIQDKEEAPKHAYMEAFSQSELQLFKETGSVSGDYEMKYLGGQAELREGRIELRPEKIVIEKTRGLEPRMKQGQNNLWDERVVYWDLLSHKFKDAAFAILLLCVIILLTLILFLRERPRYWDEVLLGIFAAIIGMALFLLGIEISLTPLGQQLGSNVPSTFASIVPWHMEGMQGPLVTEGFWGILVAVVFAFVLGYGATLAEPALNALGSTVEKITVGAFKKNLLMQSVAFGVGAGIALGVLKIAYNIQLPYLLIPPYLILIVFTYFSSEEFVNFAWDSAGVTTGPITVPLVMAIGLGIGAKTGAIDGFGVLALASVGPIISVLTVGLIVRRHSRQTGVEA